MQSVPDGVTPRLLTSSVLRHLFAVLFVLVSTQQMDQTCTSWLLTWMMLFLLEYRRMNRMLQLLSAPTCYKYFLRSRRHNYTLSIKTDYDDCNFISCKLLVCYTRTYTDCLFLSISLLFDILYKLLFDNFSLNEDDDDVNFVCPVPERKPPPARGPGESYSPPLCTERTISFKR